MVQVRMEERPAFRVAGRKTWIAGTDPEQFGRFWRQCHEDGLMDILRSIGARPGPQTGGMALGVSMVEKDPGNRDFYFLVCAECAVEIQGHDVEEYTVPAARWAVFRGSGPMLQALLEAEMHAFTVWLPQSGLRHAAAPEMEVYLPDGGNGESPVEFWLPVE